jgi:hypothetical protein
LDDHPDHSTWKRTVLKSGFRFTADPSTTPLCTHPATATGFLPCKNAKTPPLKTRNSRNTPVRIVFFEFHEFRGRSVGKRCIRSPANFPAASVFTPLRCVARKTAVPPKGTAHVAGTTRLTDSILRRTVNPQPGGRPRGTPLRRCFRSLGVGWGLGFQGSRKGNLRGGWFEVFDGSKFGTGKNRAGAKSRTHD